MTANVPPTVPRRRIDQLLVERGLFESRARAQAAIAAGLVRAAGILVRKASEEFAPDADLAASPEHPWVSRGGVKLVAALDAFGIDPVGRACLDVGASTGGFTDVLLARGARCVHAVDAGRGQLHPRLQLRPEVVSLEETDIRDLAPGSLPEAPDLVVVDVSFIPLALVLPAVSALAAPGTDLIALIKPQFEVGRGRHKKGIVRDPGAHRSACDGVAALLPALGWTVLGLVESPIAGGDGNREFLIGARRG